MIEDSQVDDNRKINQQIQEDNWIKDQDKLSQLEGFRENSLEECFK